MKKYIVSVILLIICLAVCGCSGGPFAQDIPASEPTSEITPVPAETPAPTPAPTPEPYAEGFDMCGKHCTTDDASLDLRNVSEGDLILLKDVAPYMKNLLTVELGDEVNNPKDWNLIKSLEDIFPEASFDYSFSLYGEPMTLNTEYIDLRKIPVNDEGEAVVKALPCMKKAFYLDMDSCGVGDERMAEIRDAFPDIKVVWRVHFGSLDYSARTDVKTILCSLSGIGDYAGLTNEESCRPLTYFTDLVNLDCGHNSVMQSLYYLEYMPNLEVLITYENYIRDISGLKYAKNLRYLELFGSSMKDVSAIAELDNLTDLMLCACYNVSDISALIPADVLPNLTRFYIAGTEQFIPHEQIEQFKVNHPNCEVNTDENSVGTHWRFIDLNIGNSRENQVPQYQEICDIFHYSAENRGGYNLSPNDPYYTTPHGEPVEGEKMEWYYGHGDLNKEHYKTE